MSKTRSVYSQLVQKALVFAAKRHTAPRKGSDIPYITHPAHTAIMLARYGFDDEVLAAAILHDTLEDTQTKAAELNREFGEEVSMMVQELSEPHFAGRSKRETWDQRKQAKLSMLESASPGALAIAAADRVHNTGNILRDIEENGPEVWNRFNSSPEKILEFGQKVLEILRRRFPHPLTEEYAELHRRLKEAPRP